MFNVSKVDNKVSLIITSINFKYLIKMIMWDIKYFSNKWKVPRRLIGKSNHLKAAGQE